MYLGNLAIMRIQTHAEATKHFLASLNFVSSSSHDTTGSIEFYIGPTKYSISFRDICDVYGFSISYYQEVEEATKASMVWRSIASLNELYCLHGSRYTKIKNPSIRYVLCLLANAFYARDIAKDYYGQPIDRDTTYHGSKGASMFFDHISNIRSSNTHILRPRIFIGGMLTPLFNRLNVDISDYPPISLSPVIDVTYALEHHILSGRYPPNHLIYTFLDDDGEPLCCYLPTLRCNTSSNRDLRFILPHHLPFKLPSQQPSNPHEA
ncbi:unnamed protein product [Arabis nemorensis]|uniref:Arabidopsis retrotransposon Orf1 C-terminal domain-containing protein n=1 Tax=Arabis nemorensis TaxID=586526 RepID=A0A565BTV5_9BRAS|nr:unnamed protein product [Arabis nemorensis]